MTGQTTQSSSARSYFTGLVLTVRRELLQSSALKFIYRFIPTVVLKIYDLTVTDLSGTYHRWLAYYAKEYARQRAALQASAQKIRQDYEHAPAYTFLEHVKFGINICQLQVLPRVQGAWAATSETWSTWKVKSEERKAARQQAKAQAESQAKQYSGSSAGVGASKQQPTGAGVRSRPGATTPTSVR